jgi:predicted RND superfamily exporter protein
MKTLLGRLAALVLRRPRFVIVVAVIACLGLGSVALTVPVDLSFAGVIGGDDPAFQRFVELRERMGVASRLLLLLEGPDDDLASAAAAVAAALEPLEDVVASVQVEVPTEWLEAHAPWVVPDPLFDRWLEAALHPADLERARTLAADFEALRGQPDPFARPGARLVVVDLRGDPMDVDIEAVVSGNSPYSIVERTTAAALARFDGTWGFTGLGAMAVQDQARTLQTITALTPLSLIAVLSLLIFVERRPLRLALIALPMLLAMCATLGAVSLVFGKLTFNEAFFGMFIFGLGVDYALHLVVRMREERALGRTFEAALTSTIVGAGRGIAAGAITTAGAFSALIWVSDPVPRHMGVAGALGLLFCLALMLSLLPAAWVLLDRKDRTPPPRGVLKVPLVGPIGGWAVRHPRTVVGVAAVLCVAALLGTPRFRSEVDLARIFNRDVPAVGVGDRIEGLFDVHFTPWIVVSDTLAEAQEVHRDFEADPLFTRVVGAGSLFPGRLETRHRRLREAQEELEASGAAGAALRAAAAQGPPEMADLPRVLRSRIQVADGGFLTLAYVAGEGLDGNKFRESRLHAEAVHPSASGMGAGLEASTMGAAKWGRQTFVLILAMVLMILAVDLRDPRWVMLAITPVLVGGLVTFGILCWFDVGFTVLLVIVVPLLIGLGVDDGIHVVHRMLEDPGLAPEQAAESVGRAIVMTTGTTCASFGVLLFSNHPGMESMAYTMLLGLPLCLLGSMTLIPAMAVLLGLREPAPRA